MLLLKSRPSPNRMPQRTVLALSYLKLKTSYLDSGWLVWFWSQETSEARI